jgi:hypothetical protein
MAPAKRPASKTMTCPDCGLMLCVTTDAPRFKIVYDIRDWRRTCKRVHLGDAAWCLVQRDGTYALPPAKNGGGDVSDVDRSYARGVSD